MQKTRGQGQPDHAGAVPRDALRQHVLRAGRRRHRGTRQRPVLRNAHMAADLCESASGGGKLELRLLRDARTADQHRRAGPRHGAALDVPRQPLPVP